jgi:hypothetical protein
LKAGRIPTTIFAFIVTVSGSKNRIIFSSRISTNRSKSPASNRATQDFSEASFLINPTNGTNKPPPWIKNRLSKNLPTDDGDCFNRNRQWFRRNATQIIHSLQANPFVKIIPASLDLFRRALKLYEQRPDKNWGLTGSASFIMLSEINITDALATDEDFRQAGFKVLLLD